MYKQKEKRTIVHIFMRIVLLLLFLCNFIGYSLGQTIIPKVSLNCDNVPLESVLKLIQQQFRIEFIYDATLVLNKKVSCNLDNVSLDKALEILLSQHSISFKKYPENSVVLFNCYPEKTTLFGVIMDSLTRKNLAGANIYLKDNHNIGTASDENGFFRLDDIPARLCTLTVYYIGYGPVEYIKKDDEKKPIYIHLKESPLLEKEITVAAQKIPSSIIHTNFGQIQFNPNNVRLLPSITNGDLIQSIQLTPGVKTVQDHIDGLYIQKGTPDQNLLLLDGIPVIRGEHLWGYYNAFNQNAIKNVTLHKAGFSSRFGDRLSSIIELEGDTGNRDNIEFGAGADIFCMNGFIKIPVNSKFRSAFAMRRSIKSIGFNKMYYNFEDYIFLLKRRYRTDLDHGNMFQFYDLVGKLEYDLSDKNRLALTSFTTYDKVDISTINKDRNINNGERFEEWKNLGIGLNWKINWNEWISSDFHTSYSKYKNKYFYHYNIYGDIIFINTIDGSEMHKTYSFPIEEFDYYSVNQLNYKSDHLLKVNERFSLLAGVELIRTEIKHHMPQEHFLYKTDHSLDNEYELFIDMPISCMSWSNIIYLENYLNLHRNLDLTLGFRNNFYSLLMKNYLDPRIEISYNFLGIKLKSIWGKYHQYLHRMSIDAGDFNPMRTSYYWMLAYDQLKLESARHLLLAATYNTAQYEFSIHYFNKEYLNLVKLIPGVKFASVDHYSNFIQIDNGKGLSRGIEFLIKKNSGSLTGWLSYQLGFARYKFSQINQHQWYDADYNRTHEFNIVALLAQRRWQCSLLTILATGTPYSTADHTIFSVPIEYDFSSYIDPTNIYNNLQPVYLRSDIKFTYNLFIKSKFTIQTGFTLYNISNHKNVIDQYYASLDDYTNKRKSNITELDRTLFLFCNFSFK
jgi:ferric enterobactin receptor